MNDNKMSEQISPTTEICTTSVIKIDQIGNQALDNVPTGQSQKRTSNSSKISPFRIEYLNSQFLVYDEVVAQNLLNECRIIAEPYGTRFEARADIRKLGAPFVFMPEQVVQLKNAVGNSGTERESVEVSRVPSEESKLLDDVELRRKAEMIAKGRKAKKLKRQADNTLTAAALKVRRCDIDSVEVTVSEIDETLNELLKNASASEQRDAWQIPLYDTRDQAYEELGILPLPESSFFRIRLNTFRDLWRRGYYLTSGLKFGCDYLAYEAIPGVEHSKWLVKCVDSQDALLPLDLIALSRVSSQVKKRVLLAIVSPDSLSPYYIEYSWWGPQRSQKLQ